MVLIHEKILAIAKALGISVYQLAKDLGYKRPDKLYHIVNGKSKPSFDTISELLRLHPEINANWLFKNEGPMFINNQPYYQNASLESISREEDEKKETGSTSVVSDRLLQVEKKLTLIDQRVSKCEESLKKKK